MAPLPPFLVRLATVYLTPVLTAALTRRLAQSPTFLRAVDQMIHHIDHFPSRLEGKPVPPYRGPPPGTTAAGDPTAKGMREWAEEWSEWSPARFA